MNRAILQACLPALIALGVIGVLMWLTVKISGAKWNWKRFRSLHRCEDGGVQSLSFVLTLPLFLMLMQLIVQISQLMIGIMGVNYAAFASARAAVVWLPAEVYSSNGLESQNQYGTLGYIKDGDVIVMPPTSESVKYQRIRLAAVLGVAPFCPSRDLESLRPGYTSARVQTASTSTQQMYQALVPTNTNLRIDQRIDNKIRWADQNTSVIVEWRDARNANGTNTLVSPTYNPMNHDDPEIVWDPYEVGWQDPVTVHVVHRFALLPGPGRWLAQRLVWSNQLPPRVTTYIDPLQFEQTGSDPNTIVIPASATLVTEGLKTVFSYDHEDYQFNTPVSGSQNQQ